MQQFDKCDFSDKVLISRAAHYPELYDRTHPQFNFFSRKPKVWDQIAASFKGDIDGKALSKRWRILKCSYYREREQVRSSTKVDPKKRKVWKHFYAMRFIDKVGTSDSAKKKATNNPAKKKATNNPAKKKANNNPAKKKANNNPAKKKANNNSAKKKGTNNPAKKKGTNNPAKKKGTNNSAKKKKSQVHENPDSCVRMVVNGYINGLEHSIESSNLFIQPMEYNAEPKDFSEVHHIESMRSPYRQLSDSPVIAPKSITTIPIEFPMRRIKREESLEDVSEVHHTESMRSPSRQLSDSPVIVPKSTMTIPIEFPMRRIKREESLESEPEDVSEVHHTESMRSPSRQLSDSSVIIPESLTLTPIASTMRGVNREESLDANASVLKSLTEHQDEDVSFVLCLIPYFKKLAMERKLELKSKFMQLLLEAIKTTPTNTVSCDHRKN